MSLQWRHNGRDSVSNHQPHDCLLNRLFRHRSKKPSKLRVTGLCEGNSLVAGEFPAQRTSNVENISIWWRYHVQLHFLGLKLPYSICKKKKFLLMGLIANKSAMVDAMAWRRRGIKPSPDPMIPWSTTPCSSVNKSSQRLPNTPICQHQWRPC